MYKVVLVDDEVMVKEGMKMILTQSGKWRVVGEATNGRQAIEQIRQLQPDLVISDIRMPELSGIELLQAIHDTHPDVAVVLLTGYADFEYAQQALRFGAFEYLLKPSKAQEIIAVLDKAEQWLESKRKEQQHVLEYKRKVEIYEQSVSEKWMRDLLYGQEVEIAAISHLPFFQLALRITVVTWLTEGSANPAGHLLRVLKSISPGGIESLSFGEKNGEWVIVLGWDERWWGERVKETLLSTRASIHQLIMKHGYDWRVGFSETRPIAEASRLYDQSKFAVHHTAPAVPLLSFESLRNEPVSGVVIPIDLQFALLKAVKEADSREAAILFGQLQAYVEKCSLSAAVTQIGHFYEQVSACLFALNQSFRMDEREAIPHLTSFHSKKEAVDWLYDKLRSHIEQVRRFREKRINPVIQRILTSLQEKRLVDVKLGDFAKDLGLTPSYVSTLFKQEMDVSFSDYVCHLRIEKAKAMLLKDRYKVYEIAQELGYVDGRHFSQIFKKATGVTPMEYRRDHGGAILE